MLAPGDGYRTRFRMDRPEELKRFRGDQELDRRWQRENSAAIDDLLRRAYARLRGVFRRG